MYYYEWSRPKPVKLGAGTPSDDQKMLFGLFFQLKVFAAAMDPKGCAVCKATAPSYLSAEILEVWLYQQVFCSGNCRVAWQYDASEALLAYSKCLESSFKIYACMHGSGSRMPSSVRR